METDSILRELLQTHHQDLAEGWLREQVASGVIGGHQTQEVRAQIEDFLSAFSAALQHGAGNDISSSVWAGVREVLTSVSNRWAQLGMKPSETAEFIFTLKRPLFDHLRSSVTGDPDVMAEALWRASHLLDRLGLYTTDVSLRRHESIINRQQEELLELSTPVVKLWENILALPLIGTLDSARTQVVMESLLNEIVASGSEIAIIDITGVPTVDTLVAQHLLKTVAAARLMGAECIISGIRPQIAQTIVHLGVDLGEVATKATLADAFQLALRRTGQRVVTDGPDVR